MNEYELRNKNIEIAFKMARYTSKNYTWDRYRALTEWCSDNEIFMCETENGFYIEDERFECNR